MQLGLIGLGRMGAGLADRLLQNDHSIAGFDLSAESVARFVSAGGTGAASLQDLVAQLAPPRALWVMVPHGDPTRKTIETLLQLLAADDIIIDGGNSHYADSVLLAEQCRESGVHFMDVGVSGGVWGAAEGFNLMVGGSGEAFARMEPVFNTLAPQGGYALVGGSGAGHFVKMIHNAIEYAMLQAIGEGFECLHRSDFNLDAAKIAALWQNGSVVRSWLMELLGRALREEGNALANIGDHIDDSGTGRWTVEYALSKEIPVPAISISLYERFDSRLQTRYAHQVIAALRAQFGGHAIAEPEG